MQVSLTKARASRRTQVAEKNLHLDHTAVFFGAWRHKNSWSKDTRWAVHISLRVRIAVK